MKKKIISISIKILIVLFISFVYIKFVSTKRLEVREYKIVDSNITSDYYGLKIVHFGDIHYNNNINIEYLKNVVDKINLSKPDIVIFTGDLIDSKFNITNEDKDSIVEILSSINSRLGKYAIKGDEDIMEDYPSIIRKANFIYLENNFEYVYDSDVPILISDMNSEILDDNKAVYNILLVHKPDDLLDLDYSKYNLILSGHSHNGQIILPFIGPLFKFEGSKTYYDRYYELNNSKLYITGGIGTKKINMRLNNRPSINLYRLVNK